MRRAALSTRLRRIEEEVGWIEWQVEQLERGQRPIVMDKGMMEAIEAISERYTMEELAAMILENAAGEERNVLLHQGALGGSTSWTCTARSGSANRKPKRKRTNEHWGES